MKFREHRGLLGDSMATLVDVADWAALVAHIVELFDPWPSVTVREEDIAVEPLYSHRDTRIGWDATYLVTLKGYGVVGYTNGPLLPP